MSQQGGIDLQSYS